LEEPGSGGGLVDEVLETVLDHLGTVGSVERLEHGSDVVTV